MSIVLPQEEDIRAVAYKCWQLGGMLHGHDKADWRQAEQLLFLHYNYQTIFRYPLQADAKLNVGTKDNRRCRYCKRKPPEVSFRKVAHAISEFLGNKLIFSSDECDTCNKHFSENLEDHLGKWLNASMSLTMVKGKKGVPSFKTNAKKSRIDVNGSRIEMQVFESDPLAEWDAAEQELRVAVTTKPFVPLAAFKCLTKMALAVMPTYELQNFEHTMDWIREPDHSIGAEHFTASALCYHTFQPGPIASEVGQCILLRRKNPIAELPYMLFSVLFRNQALQIMLPCCPADNHWVGKKVPLPPIPEYFGFGYRFGEPVRKSVPLSSPERTTIPCAGTMRAESVTHTVFRDNNQP